jgi:hypothetical protein
VGLERGPLSLVRITEELIEWNSSGSGLENRVQRSWESVALTTRHPLSAKLALTSPTSGGRSVGIVHLKTKSRGVFHFLAVKMNSSETCYCVLMDLPLWVVKDVTWLLFAPSLARSSTSTGSGCCL